MSASSTPTLSPLSRKPSARFTAVVDLPTPPLPEATAMIERAMDLLARELQIDPAELRRRNLIRTFPFNTTVGSAYDSGDYVAALDRALEVCGYGELRREQAERRARPDA